MADDQPTQQEIAFMFERVVRPARGGRKPGEWARLSDDRRALELQAAMWRFVWNFFALPGGVNLDPPTMRRLWAAVLAADT